MSHCWRRTFYVVVLLLLGPRVWGAEQPPPAAGYFPALNNSEAWQLLPRAEIGQGASLPIWARVMARSLPGTTAAMLELDYLHRARSPLDAWLRGKMRWAAAHANRCPYSEACALDDLKRAGMDEKALHMLQNEQHKLPEKERRALVFASKMMSAAYSVTDEEVADLIKWYGEKPVVAMVLMLAHASFQDRVILSLGLGDDRNSPLPPPVVLFARTEEAREHVKAPERKQPDAPAVTEKWQPDRDWLSLNRDRLQEAMSEQKERPSRIRIPTRTELTRFDPPDGDASRKGGSKVIWNSVTSGYQKELAAGWTEVTRSFGKEAKQKPVFSNSVFWVVTRSLQCFY
jgi:alkylhydroperoxidase family enzyme